MTCNHMHLSCTLCSRSDTTLVVRSPWGWQVILVLETVYLSILLLLQLWRGLCSMSIGRSEWIGVSKLSNICVLSLTHVHGAPWRQILYNYRENIQTLHTWQCVLCVVQSILLWVMYMCSCEVNGTFTSIYTHKLQNPTSTTAHSRHCQACKVRKLYYVYLSKDVGGTEKPPPLTEGGRRHHSH